MDHHKAMLKECLQALQSLTYEINEKEKNQLQLFIGRHAGWSNSNSHMKEKGMLELHP